MSMTAKPWLGWSRRSWAWIIAGGLATHAGMVFWIGERAKPAGPVAPPPPLLKMVWDEALRRDPSNGFGLADPTLFALPSADGFSSLGWLSTPPLPLPQTEWSESPRWLPLDTNELGAVFLRFVAASKSSGSMVDEMLKMRTTTADILLLYDPQTTQSVVRIDGPLAQRPLLQPVEVPNPAVPDVLTNTVVRVRVNRDGIVESAIVLGSCGIKAVDEKALVSARETRFEPIAQKTEGGLEISLRPEWGSVVYDWYTLPPASTNAATAN